MRNQPIKRCVDALRTQGRFVLYLACGHYASVPVSALDLEFNPELVTRLQAADSGTETLWPCIACPDPPPVVREKTPQDLWREAGEP